MRTPRLAAIMLVAGLTACSNPDTPATWHTGSPQASAPAPSPNASATEITLAFAGDLHFHDRTVRLLNNPQTAVGPFSKQLKAADFAMVNLETAVTSRGAEEPKRYHFRTVPKAYEAIQAAGIDLVSVANNHALDYGQVGLLDTLDSAKAAGMPLVGAGRTADEAYAPHIVTVKGVRIAVIGLSQVYELSGRWKATATKPGIAMAFDQARSIKAVKDARAQADVVIVYLHWGNESQACPSALQKTAAKFLSQAGADIVLGTHAHVLLADGFLGSTYVHYGLGNFVWHSDFRGTDTGLLEIKLVGGKVRNRTFTPGVTSSATGGQPRPATGSALKAIQDRLAKAERCSGLAPNPRS